MGQKTFVIIKKFRFKVICAWYIVFSGIASLTNAQDFTILPNGHSHNDYTRDKPLHDALSYGFTSIEVDVYWYGNRMVVTHDDKHLDDKPSLQELYLDPLNTIIRNNNGSIFKDNETQLILMIDLKSEKVSTYKALKEIFSHYLDYIEWFKNGDKIHGPIQVLLSGGPPIELIEKETDRYFYVDGALDQWSMDYSVELMPRASTNYRSYFNWYGLGEMPKEEVDRLKELISKAHESKRKVRFWGCPNRVNVWKKLLDEGADWINVDDLKGFNEFYIGYKSAN